MNYHFVCIFSFTNNQLLFWSTIRAGLPVCSGQKELFMGNNDYRSTVFGYDS